MKKNIEIEELGTLTVVKNEFTGSFRFYLNNEEFNKVSSKKYVISGKDFTDLHLTLMGNQFSGYSVMIDDNKYLITEPFAWYSYVFMVIPLIMGLVLGNIRPFYDAGIYFVGGLIGGLIGGVGSAVSIIVFSTELKWYYKILLGLLVIAATFGLLYGIGNGIVAASGKK